MKILTFDIEEWFHILDNRSTRTEKEWHNYPSRIDQNMDRIFSMLELTNKKASFFVLGWIAEKYPEIVKKIAQKGFEIGSHSSYHQLAYEQTPKAFYKDVEKSIKTLEDLSGKKVRMFRAPGYSITESNKWAFETLVDLGIEIDSSVFPLYRAHGGYHSFGQAKPSIISFSGGTLKEFPINTTKYFGCKVVFSGGGYFRISPYYLIKKWTDKSDYIMTYFHPRDFDPSQPIIEDLPITRRFKSYVGLRSCESKLIKWLKEYDFCDIGEAEKKINW
ncbi:MAG: polysaccharide deacetylase [Crocinitomicaceae bacterium]|nr:polysaccharide deacetylase [Crocinitomicaceae bacterium]|tara:strand:- start:7241 stop:8065 length:825 start_codon:yes stop_codon:yes gene_type:complete